jgi:hypothetical protein
MRVMQVTELRQKLAETLEQVAESREPVEIRRHDHSVAIVVPSPELPARRAKPSLDLDQISRFCRRHEIKSFALFGSILRDDFDEESDVDVLVDLGERQVSFHEYCDMLESLELMFGRKVDLLERNIIPQLNPRRGSAISSTAKVIYEAA